MGQQAEERVTFVTQDRNELFTATLLLPQPQR
jgi:hypothetical protein